MMHTTVNVGDADRTYTVVGDQDASHRRALVLMFHGSKQDGEVHRQFTGRSFDALAGSGAAVVAYLDGYKGNWNDARRESYFPARLDDVDDVGFVRAVVSEIEGSHHIDPDRVFAVGYSNGGQMVMRLVHELPGLLAGAAVLSATMPAPESFVAPTAAEARPLPVLLVHGTRDPIAPYDGGTMRWWARRLFKVGGASLSMPATAEYFARRNGITTTPSSSRLPRGAGASGTTWVEQTDYRDAGKPMVRLLTLHDAGHTIPGPRKAPFVLGRTNQDISAADAASDFFGLRAPAPASD